MSCRNCDILDILHVVKIFFKYWESHRCMQVKHRVEKTHATCKGHE